MAKHRHDRHARRQRPRPAPSFAHSAYHDVLCNHAILALLLQFQHGVFYQLLPRYRSWTRQFLSGALTGLTQRELHLSSQTDPRYIVHRAIFDNDLASVRLLQRCRPHLLTSAALPLAAASGHVEMTAFLLDLGLSSSNALDFAAANGHVAVCQQLQDTPSTPNAVNAAATNGHLNVVKFLHSLNQHEATTDAMDGAAQHKHLDIVQFLHFHRSEGCTTLAMDSAALNGDLPMLEFLHTHRAEGCTPRAMDMAATHGYMEIMRYLHTHRPEGVPVGF
ncbi:hypothetical protein AaE_003422 [Aphanomyces astaci]|uniref:Uncharacterized protein n=1 Tax=Aphanomyces astaci TaxID=112090 RepID=A0A6A5A780_APHAT|nr:hypothetical protein AaE_003422 [Aphanomyces astaci]